MYLKWVKLNKTKKSLQRRRTRGLLIRWNLYMILWIIAISTDGLNSNYYIGNWNCMCVFFWDFMNELWTFSAVVLCERWSQCHLMNGAKKLLFSVKLWKGLAVDCIEEVKMNIYEWMKLQIMFMNGNWGITEIFNLKISFVEFSSKFRWVFCVNINFQVGKITAISVMFKYRIIIKNILPEI